MDAANLSSDYVRLLKDDINIAEICGQARISPQDDINIAEICAQALRCVM